MDANQPCSARAEAEETIIETLPDDFGNLHLLRFRKHGIL
jgi:hypothetical protein